MSRRNLKASMLLALISMGASPAFAGRGTQIDAPVQVNGCTFGSTTCDFVDLSSSGGPFSKAYIYQEGIVSIDALLPTSANASDPSTFGTGIWFTPGISPDVTYTVNAYFALGFDTTPDSWGLNFFAPGSPTVDGNGGALAPDMQVFLSSGTGTFLDGTQNWDGVSAVLGYSPTYVPPAGAWIGFSWGDGAVQLVQNTNGLLVGPAQTDTDFVSTAGILQSGGSLSAPTQFIPLYAPGVPEPGTWAMLLIGFAMIGLMLRRRPWTQVAFA